MSVVAEECAGAYLYLASDRLSIHLEVTRNALHGQVVPAAGGAQVAVGRAPPPTTSLSDHGRHDAILIVSVRYNIAR